MKKPVIKIENLEKSFGKGQAKTRVLKGIDLDIFPGEFVIIFGPSGCGKSTLLNTIVGLEKPTSGKVFLKGADVYLLKDDERSTLRHNHFGIVYQQANWIQSLNILENVAFPLNIGGYTYLRSLTRSRNALTLFNLDKFSKNRPTELSGGQQQKVATVRALISNPEIILADEPTGNLDKISSDDLMYVFKSLNEEFKRTIVMVTHNPEYEKFASKLVFMEDGKIKEVRLVREVALSPNLESRDIIMGS
ncbi:MAG: ABC transporter ATP-binding protein [Patescibacteria group bacterium]|nr:ABC transporter ATP-binding protein [Patescibacteria group bacterium]